MPESREGRPSAADLQNALEVVAKSIPRNGSLGEFVAHTLNKNKLAVVEESIATVNQLHALADEVIGFLSREYGEHLPGERPDVERLLELATTARRSR